MALRRPPARIELRGEDVALLQQHLEKQASTSASRADQLASTLQDVSTFSYFFLLLAQHK